MQGISPVLHDRTPCAKGNKVVCSKKGPQVVDTSLLLWNDGEADEEDYAFRFRNVWSTTLITVKECLLIEAAITGSFEWRRWSLCHTSH